MKENIKVFVQIRPVLEKELHHVSKSRIAVKKESSTSVKINNSTYNYDAVFDPTDTQVYSSVRPIVEHFLLGHNVSIFSYGQTNSGKTYTLGFSDPKSVGIVQQAIEHVFHSDMESPVTFSCTFLETYNEEVIDLLHKSVFVPKKDHLRPLDDSQSIVIRQDSKGIISWKEAKHMKITSITDAFNALEQGLARRSTNITTLNPNSSRSHAIFTLFINRSNGKTSKLNFVDLAGSERLKKTNAFGDRKKEGISINSGLLALSNVISALSSPQITHVPYRDSKLTRLLQDTLGGDSITLMLACISPTLTDLSETLNTLKYASCARKIRNAPISSSVLFDKKSDIGTLKNEIERLRSELVALQPNEENWNLQENLRDVQENYDYLVNQFEYVSNALNMQKSIPIDFNVSVKKQPDIHDFASQTSIDSAELNSNMKNISFLEEELNSTKLLSIEYFKTMISMSHKVDSIETTCIEQNKKIERLLEELLQYETKELNYQKYVQDLESQIQTLKEKAKVEEETTKGYKDNAIIDSKINMQLREEIDNLKAFQIEKENSHAQILAKVLEDQSLALQNERKLLIDSHEKEIEILNEVNEKTLNQFSLDHERLLSKIQQEALGKESSLVNVHAAEVQKISQEYERRILQLNEDLLAMRQHNLPAIQNVDSSHNQSMNDSRAMQCEVPRNFNAQGEDNPFLVHYRNENSVLVKSMRELTETNTQLQDHVKEVNIKYEELDEKYKALEERVIELQENERILRNTVVEVIDKDTETTQFQLEDELTLLHDYKNELGESFEFECQRLTHEVTVLSSCRDVLLQGKRVLEVKLDSLKSELNAANLKCEGLNKDLLALSHARQFLLKQNDVLEGELRDIKSKLVSSTSEHLALKSARITVEKASQWTEQNGKIASIDSVTLLGKNSALNSPVELHIQAQKFQMPRYVAASVQERGLRKQLEVFLKEIDDLAEENEALKDEIRKIQFDHRQTTRLSKSKRPQSEVYPVTRNFHAIAPLSPQSWTPIPSSRLQLRSSLDSIRNMMKVKHQPVKKGAIDRFIGIFKR